MITHQNHRIKTNETSDEYQQKKWSREISLMGKYQARESDKGGKRCVLKA